MKCVQALAALPVGGGIGWRALVVARRWRDGRRRGDGDGDGPTATERLPVGGRGAVSRRVRLAAQPQTLEYREDARSKTVTYASGIESGTFAVNDGQCEIRVDTDWLAEAHDGVDITTVSPEWSVSTSLSSRSWSSPYIHLDDYQALSPTADVDGLFEDVADESPNDGYLDVKAVLDGQTLAVRGELTVEQGPPVLRGSDETPLALSDQGFDAFGSDLRRQVLNSGLLSGGLAVPACLALANGLGLT